MFECKEHGRVRGRKNVNYCPICGKEVIPIPLFPLAKVYVWKGDLFKAALVLATAAVAIAVIAASSSRKPHGGYGSRHTLSGEERMRVDAMPPDWQFAYRIASRLGTHDRSNYLRRYMQQNQEKLSQAPLTQPQIDLFLDLVSQYEMADLATHLGKFHKPAPTTHSSGV